MLFDMKNCDLLRVSERNDIRQRSGPYTDASFSLQAFKAKPAPFGHPVVIGFCQHDAFSKSADKFKNRNRKKAPRKSNQHCSEAT